MTMRYPTSLTLPVLVALAGLQSGMAAADDAKSPPAIPYEANLKAGGEAPPGGKMVNPFKADDATAIKTGGEMFSAMNCDGCHGGGAAGAAAPSLADQRWRYGGADEEIYQTIFYGRPKGMPAFGGLMSPGDVWAIVTYLKSLPPPDATQSWVDK